MTTLRNAPAHWHRATIGEIAEVTGGIQKQPSRLPRNNTAPYLRVANVQRGSLDLTDVHRIELFEGELPRFRLRRGDLLVVEGNGSLQHIGRSALWTGEMADCVHQNHLIRVRPGPEVLPEFLNHYWNSPAAVELIRDAAQTTSGLYTLSTGKVRSVPVAVPPLCEQRTIVEKVERMQSVVEAAVRMASAAGTKTLTLDAALLHAFTSSPPGGTVVPFGQLLTESLRNGHSAKESPDGTGIRTLTLTAVTKGLYDETTSKVTVADPERVSDLWLQPDDLLIQRANTPELVGTARRYSGPSGWAIFPDLIIRARVDAEMCLPGYAELALRSPVTHGYFRRAARGGAGSMPKINQNIIQAAPLVVPSLPTQARILDDYAAASSRVARQRQAVDTTVRRGEALRRSILKAAFEGRLTRAAQDAQSLDDLQEAIA